MIEFNDNIKYLKEPDDANAVDTNTVLNAHVKRKLLEFETALLEIGATAPDFKIIVAAEGTIDSNTPDFKRGIKFDWTKCADPEINAQIQLLQDNFFAKK